MAVEPLRRPRPAPTTVTDVAVVLAALPHVLATTAPLPDQDRDPNPHQDQDQDQDPDPHQDPHQDQVPHRSPTDAGERSLADRTAQDLATAGYRVVLIDGLPADGVVGWQVSASGRRRAVRLESTSNGEETIVVTRLGRIRVPSQPAWTGRVYAEGGRPSHGWPDGWQTIEDRASPPVDRIQVPDGSGFPTG